MVSAAGSGELLFTPRIGAQYGYALVWALLVAVALKWVVNREVGRYTVVTGEAFLQGAHRLAGPRGWAVWMLALPQVVVAVATIAGLAGAAGTALVLALPGDIRVWTIGDVAYRFSRFLSIESCGQCPPCKLGSSAITENLERIETGVGDAGDLDVITGWLGHVTDGNRCYLAVEEQTMVTSIMRAFAEEFAEHLELGRCPRPRRLPIPKLIDLADGRAVYDDSFWRKQPDWTYAADDQDAPAHRQ